MNDVERKTWRREQMERWLASDGMGVEEWCRLNRMSTSTFYLWLNRFREEEPEIFGPRPAKGWVEIARQERRDSLALAVANGATAPMPARHAGVPAAAIANEAQPAPITVSVGDATISIPAGSGAADIANVMGAVMRR